jgi:hypothetical protein
LDLIFSQVLDNWPAQLLEGASMKLRDKHIKLTWDKLLGFNQVKRAQGELKSKSAKALMEAKIGAKPGIKYLT